MSSQQVPKEVSLGEFMSSRRFTEYFPVDSVSIFSDIAEMILAYSRASFRAGWEACENAKEKK